MRKPRTWATPSAPAARVGGVGVETLPTVQPGQTGEAGQASVLGLFSTTTVATPFCTSSASWGPVTLASEPHPTARWSWGSPPYETGPRGGGGNKHKGVDADVLLLINPPYGHEGGESSTVKVTVTDSRTKSWIKNVKRKKKQLEDFLSPAELHKALSLFLFVCFLRKNCKYCYWFRFYNREQVKEEKWKGTISYICPPPQPPLSLLKVSVTDILCPPVTPEVSLWRKAYWEPPKEWAKKCNKTV